MDRRSCCDKAREIIATGQASSSSSSGKKQENLLSICERTIIGVSSVIKARRQFCADGCAGCQAGKFTKSEFTKSASK